MISSLELARLCGVSQGTVDRALHGRPGISPATRERILSVARQNGYRPNPAARELMGLQASTLVGAVVPEFSIQGAFFMDILHAISRALRGRGLRLAATLCGPDADDQGAAVDELAARRPRALLLLHPDPALRPPRGVDAPLGALIIGLRTRGCRDLLPDETITGRLAAEHLCALGHRRILYLGRDRKGSHHVARERREGFLAAAAAVGAEVAVHEGPADDGALDAALAHRATAVFCHHDPLALAMIDRCVARGLRVPDDLSVMGVDGSSLAGVRGQPLTTMAYPFAAVAEAAAAMAMGEPVPEIPPCTVAIGATVRKA